MTWPDLKSEATRLAALSYDLSQGVISVSQALLALRAALDAQEQADSIFAHNEWLRGHEEGQKEGYEQGFAEGVASVQPPPPPPPPHDPGPGPAPPPTPLHDRLGILHSTGGGSLSVPATLRAVQAGARVFRVTAPRNVDEHLGPMAGCVVYRTITASRVLNKTVESWEREVREKVTALGNRVSVWGFLNEANPPKGATSTLDPVAYAEHFVVMARVVKELQPHARVAAFDWRGQAMGSDWCRRVIDAPSHPLDHADLWSHHVIPSEVGSAQRILDICGETLEAARAYVGPDLPIWLTEVGAGSEELGEDGQADFLSAVLPALLDMGYEVALWALLRDGASSNESWSYRSHGLYRDDANQTPKPAADALDALLRGGT